jgi:Big-like domain-containing protein
LRGGCERFSAVNPEQGAFDMSGLISWKYPSLCRIAISILLMVSFSACSNGAAERSGGPGTPASGGGISFRLVWQRTPLSGAKARLSPPFNACVDHGIDTIAATVSNGTVTVTNSWPCSLHEGVVLGVSAGTYDVTIDGKASGVTTWSGLASAITVTNQIADAGTIIMSYIGTDTGQPTVTSITPASNPSVTTNVPVTDRIIIAFSEPMAISTVSTTSITLINSGDMSTVSGVLSYVTASNAAAFIPSANLAYDTQYVLQVASGITDLANNQLVSDYTNTFMTESVPVDAPAAPSGVAARPGNGQVTLDWLASNGTASYNVYYLSSAGVTTTNGTKISDARAPYVHVGLANSQTYYYLVTSVNSTGETEAAAEVNATPSFPASSPAAPASLEVTPGSSQNVITWPTVAGATSYNLYWSAAPITPDITSADNVIRGVTCFIATCSFTHTGLTTGQTYYYILTAANSSGESAGSMQAASTPD